MCSFLRTTIFLLLAAWIVAFAPRLAAQDWAWMEGSTTVGATSVHGTLNVPHPDNTPGSRYSYSKWRDANGDFWLFGGCSLNPNVVWWNDMWKYSPSTGEWTWMAGSSTPNSMGSHGLPGESSTAYIPSARGGANTWIDASGNFWLYGGVGYDQDSPEQGRYKGDFWKFSPTTLQWTYVTGSTGTNFLGNYGVMGTPAATNYPGARGMGMTWTGNDGKLWMYGGGGYGVTGIGGHLGDLWTFNPATIEWTHVGGTTTYSQPANYGQLGVASATNHPGARRSGTAWTDANGHFWLFGGYNYSLIPPAGGEAKNDIWEFDPATSMWTWRSGSSQPNQLGVYGTIGVPGASTPGARYAFTSWKDNSGNIWVFGGYGYDATYMSRLNDLWQYSPTANQWTFVKGSGTGNQAGNYGTQGVAAPDRIPGGRYECSGWTDLSGNLWLYGGYGAAAVAPPFSALGDMWKFTISIPPTVNAGTDQLLTLGYGPQSIMLSASASGGTPPYTYLWSPSGTGSSILVSPMTTTTYSVTVTDANNQTATDNVTVTVLDWRCGNNLDKVTLCHNGHTICVAMSAVQAHLDHGDYLGGCLATKDNTSLPMEFAMSQNYPNPFNPVTHIDFSIPDDGTVDLAVFDLFGRKVKQIASEMMEAGTHHVDFSAADFPSGIYVYRLEWNGHVITRRMTLMK